MPLVLITAADCHLCERAHEVLGALDLEAREVDIESAEADELRPGAHRKADRRADRRREGGVSL